MSDMGKHTTCAYTVSTSLIDLLERAVVALETIASAPGTSTDADNRRQQAMMLLPELGPNVKAIAKRLGCSRTTLHSDDKFMAIVNQMKAGRSVTSGTIRQGVRDRSGSIEAWEYKDLE